MEQLNEKDELLAHLQSLKQHAGFQYLCQVVETWKNQTLSELIAEPNFEKVKELRAEFKAYGKLLNLPVQLIQDLTSEPPITENLDPYESESAG